MSVGTFSLLQIMIRFGAVAKVTSLFYLVPPVVAIESWFLFGETLNLYQGVGMVFATCGVALIVTRKKTNEEFSK
jgi:drug/metabolite transporter (DMT)-like permease